MIRSALLLCAALLATLTFACVQAPPPPAPDIAIRPFRLACNDEPGATLFLSKVWTLDTTVGFNAAGTGNNYKPPQSAGRPSQTITDDLHDAYCIAPQFFRNDLLDSSLLIFIDPSCSGSACVTTSWGYRERPSQRPGTGKYIGLSAALWNGGSSRAINYNDYENQLLGSLLGWNGPQYNPANANGPEVTTLAALAHEMGHIRWYDAFYPARGGPPNFLGAGCGGAFFNSWKYTWSQLHTPPRWRNFSTRTERDSHPVPDQHRISPTIDEIDDAVKSASTYDLMNAGDMVDALYNPKQPSASWASFFASVSPDEDFVETYKFKVLTQALAPYNLMSMQIIIPGSTSYTENIPDDYAKGKKYDLAAKIGCI